MADEYQVIDDPNDPRLQNTPLNEEFDPNTYGAQPAPAQVVPLFDPAAYAEGKEKKVEQPPALPTFTPKKQTYYFPETPEATRAAGLSYKMEGGIHGSGDFSALDLRNHTLEQYKDGKSPFVAVAMAGVPTGAEFMMPLNGELVHAKQVDTGGGLVPGQVDVATSNPDLARGGGTGGGFNPKAYADGKPSVPDINAFMEPAPADTPEAQTQDEPTPAEIAGGAISKAASKYGAALANRPVPQFTPPQYQPPAIPQVPQQQQQVIPGQGMIGAAIPTAQPLPSPVPTPPLTGPGLHNFALSRIAPQVAGEVGGMVNAPVEQAKQAMNPQLSIPARLAAAVGTVAAAAQLDPLVPHGAVSTREVPVPESMQPQGATQAQPPLVQPPQPKGLPVKAASVQGLKNPPRTIHQMQSDVIDLKNQGRHTEAKALQGQINQLEGLTVGEQPPAPPAPPQGPPSQNPPPGGGIPPQPANSLSTFLRNRVIRDRIAYGKDSVFTYSDYEGYQRTGPLRQDFGEQTTRSDRAKVNIQANKDMEAATTIAEAQGSKVALAHDLELVRTSKDAKLGEEMLPKYQYAFDNFDRISDQLSKSRHTKLMQDTMVEDASYDIQYPEREGYVTHVLKNEPENALVSFFTGKPGSGGLSRYFTKSREFNTLAEAIHEGVRPASMNIADLDQHRIASSRRLIQNKALFNELKNIQAPDGNPVLKGVFRHPDPPHGAIVPKGYELMNLNGVEVAVHPAYSGLFKSLYGDSALRRTKFGRGVMKTTGVMKSYTLAADTYHGFRGIKKGLFYGGKGSRLGFKRGTTVYELSDEGLDTAVKNNEITQKQADWAKSARPAIEEMMKSGLNVSKYADNLVGQMHVNFPGTGRLNDLIFNRVFRGAMIQASHANYLRNLSRFPELTKQEVARRTAKEMNEVFGNLMSQGILKDKTLQDASNMILLSPQWVQSQVMAEFRGYGQHGRMISDAFQGKFRMGTVAQGQATAVLAYLVGNQIINYATTGHSTFENDGWLNKMSAFLPVGDRGVYLNPFALSAEYVDRFMTIMDRQGEDSTVASVLSEMATSKLTGAAHAVVTLATQRDWRGRKLEGSDVYLEAGKNIVPVPIGVGNVGGSLITLNPNSPMGFDFEPQYDKITQSVLQAMGERGVLGTGAQYPGAPVGIPTERGVY